MRFADIPLCLNPSIFALPVSGKTLIRECIFDHRLDLHFAIGDFALACIRAAETKISNYVIINVQQRNQYDFLFFTIRFGLLQQIDRIATFNETLSREETDPLEIIIPEAIRIVAGHTVETALCCQGQGGVLFARIRHYSFIGSARLICVKGDRDTLALRGDWRALPAINRKCRVQLWKRLKMGSE